MIIVVMGVAGSGKTTVGQLLAQELGWPFYDGDDFHPPANVAKMQAGTPLTDADRADWLEALHRLITQRDGAGKSAIIACSALKQSYWQVLGDVRIVYLKGDYERFRQRLQSRPGHFFKADLLPSQFATLEEPGDAITVDAEQEPASIVQAIRKTLKM